MQTIVESDLNLLNCIIYSVFIFMLDCGTLLSLYRLWLDLKISYKGQCRRIHAEKGQTTKSKNLKSYRFSFAIRTHCKKKVSNIRKMEITKVEIQTYTGCNKKVQQKLQEFLTLRKRNYIIWTWVRKRFISMLESIFSDSS